MPPFGSQKFPSPLWSLKNFCPPPFGPLKKKAPSDHPKKFSPLPLMVKNDSWWVFLFRFDGTTFSPNKAGLYFFAVSAVLNTMGHFAIRKNNGIECHARGDGGASITGGVSCSVVMDLHIGDTVTVYSVVANQVYNPGMCNFVGFIIKASN